MELTSEDALRLNVMLANAVAVRIDEGINVVYGLSQSGNEAKVQLNPNCRPEKYIRAVREMLSSTVLGSPGGYPVFLKRWTRMGQTADTRLADLLMLGEPEAVVAVAGAPSLTDELARRTWWIMSNSDTARRMLNHPAVVGGEMGKVLADFLLEFLPFEQEPREIIESVRLVLQPGLIDEQARLDIWNRGRQKNVFRVGFVQAVPDDLPEPQNARADYDSVVQDLQALGLAKGPLARQLIRVLSAPGQTYINTCRAILSKPANQDVVVALLETVREYFNELRLFEDCFFEVEAIANAVDAAIQTAAEGFDTLVHPLLEERKALITHAPTLEPLIHALLVLAHVGEPLVRPIFSRTDSIGSVMRRKIQPISKPIVERFTLITSAAVMVHP